MTRYLTTKQILRIHAVVIEDFGGNPTVRDIGLIESAVARPQAAYGGQEAYGSLFEKAAALISSLAANHGFIDGNKRTAYVAFGLFLKQNGYELTANPIDATAFVKDIVTHKLDEAAIAVWLKKHSAKVS